MPALARERSPLASALQSHAASPAAPTIAAASIHTAFAPASAYTNGAHRTSIERVPPPTRRSRTYARTDARMHRTSRHTANVLCFGDDVELIEPTLAAELPQEALPPPPAAVDFAFGDDAAEPQPTAAPRNDAASKPARKRKSPGEPAATVAAQKQHEPAWQGLDAKAAAQCEALATKLVASLPPEWEPLLYSFGKDVSLAVSVRKARALGRLRKCKSIGVLRNAHKGLTHLIDYLRTNGLSLMSLTADVIICSLEEHDDNARARAAARAAKREAKSLPPRRNDRGGETATYPVSLGYLALAKRLGIPLALSDEAKEVAKAGPGMPAVQPMMRLDSLRTLTQITNDRQRNKFEQAYAGGGWLLGGGGTRVIDLQRTAKIEIEKVSIFGQSLLVASGIAKRSKARNQKAMRPLHWRAPLVNTAHSGEDPVDLRPLLVSMPEHADGAVFRDFVTPPGAPHTPRFATAWADVPASHETVVQSLRELTGEPELGGHNGRHVLPEVARGLGLPTHFREALGYWRPKATVGERADQRAIKRAVTQARKRCSRLGRLASCADRYSSVDAERVEQDAARVICMTAIKEALDAWGRTDVPATTYEQILWISNQEHESRSAA